MSRKVRTIVEITDDLDGSEGVETVYFAIDGRGYEIDLSEGNAKLIRDALLPFRKAARPYTKAVTLSATQQEEIKSQELKRIREWAKAQDPPLNPGYAKIPKTTMEAYEKAHPEG